LAVTFIGYTRTDVGRFRQEAKMFSSEKDETEAIDNACSCIPRACPNKNNSARGIKIRVICR